MTEESGADRLARDVRPDRKAQAEDLRKRLTELGDLEGLAQFDANILEWKQSEWKGQDSDPVDGTVQQIAQRVMVAMTELTGNPERVAGLRVVTSLQQDLSARLRPIPDGSALIYISDVTTTLCNVYGRYAADAIVRLGSGGLKRLWRIAKAQRRGGMGEDPALLAGLLRYHNVNHRVFALAAKLEHQLAPRADEISLFFLTQAISFILGHEIAHHVLEHSPGPSAFSPAENISACSDGEQLELDADLLAYRSTLHAITRLIAERSDAAIPASFSELGAALGALIGMLAVYATEQALFVRRGRSHPPAPARAARLLEQFTPQIRTYAVLSLGDMLSATREASDFSESGRPFDLDWFVQTPQVRSSQPGDYLRMIALLDEIQCSPRQLLADSFAEWDKDSSVLPAEATHAAFAGDAMTALLAWGIPASKVKALCDPHRTLAFSSLVEAVRASFEDRCLDQPRLAAVVAAKLLSQPLTG